MALDRKQYGMSSGIPFIKIANRVEWSVDLKAKQVSGLPVALILAEVLYISKEAA